MSEFSFRALSEDELKFAKGETSKIFPNMDSGIQGCQWHRVLIDADIPDNAAVTIFFYASDSKTESKPNDDNWNGSAIFTGRYRDALLQSNKVEPVQGQYLNLKVKLSWESPKEIDNSRNEESQGLYLKSIKFYYPRNSYLRYLPAIYQRDEDSRRFLERFLSVFESSLLESDEIISNIQRYFDPLAAPADFVPWLASWLSLDLYDLIGERNRDLILHAAELYRWKGTVTGLKMLGEILEGCKCIVKEYEKNVFRTFGAERYEDYSLTPDEDNLRFHRNISMTLDTTEHELLENIGTYLDEVHYTSGKTVPRGGTSSPVGDGGEGNCIEYYPNSVGLFLILGVGDSLTDSDVKLLKRIIESFLPVFVNARIEVVPSSPFFSTFYTDGVKEEGEKVEIETTTEEHVAEIDKDRYWNCVDWKLMHTQDQAGQTCDQRFRTFHDQISKYGVSGPDNPKIKKKGPAFREV